MVPRRCPLCAPTASRRGPPPGATRPARGTGPPLGGDRRGSLSPVMATITIAGVLAAMAAANFLLDSAEHLADQGAEATNQALAEGGLTVVDVYGLREGGSMREVREVMSATLDGGAVNVSALVFELENRGQAVRFAFTASEDVPSFRVTVMRDVDGSYTAAAPLVNKGDLFEVTLPVGEAGFDIGPRDGVVQVVRGETLELTTRFQAPPTFGADELVDFAE